MAESRHDEKRSEQDIEHAGQFATNKGEEPVANNGETIGPMSANKDEPHCSLLKTVKALPTNPICTSAWAV